MPETQLQKKSERTKSAIVEAARKLFSDNGFERTTVRQIAAAAAVDPALVVRYFGGKDQLFAVAADIALDLPDMSKVERDDVGITLARHYIQAWKGNAGTGGLPILLRSAASNEAAAEHMREIFRTQVMPAILHINPGPDASQRAALIASQILGLALCRYILKLPPLVSMPADQLAVEIGQTIQRYAFGEASR
jgi:AcrR family transcriptional regulator